MKGAIWRRIAANGGNKLTIFTVSQCPDKGAMNEEEAIHE